jgi:hypothetical protein
MNAPRPAKLAFLTCPAPDVYLLNLRVEGEDFYRLEISKAQLDNMVVDGVAIALRALDVRPRSARLGLESFAPPVPDVETLKIMLAAVDLKDKCE